MLEFGGAFSTLMTQMVWYCISYGLVWLYKEFVINIEVQVPYPNIQVLKYFKVGVLV